MRAHAHTHTKESLSAILIIDDPFLRTKKAFEAGLLAFAPVTQEMETTLVHDHMFTEERMCLLRIATMQPWEGGKAFAE